MKNNYKFIFAIALMFRLLLQQSFGQTVFTDDFNRTPVTPVSDEVTPYAMTYITTVASGGGATTPANSSIAGTVLAGNLQITDGTGTVTTGNTYVTGPLSSYSGFNSTLASNTQVVQWTFNSRCSKNTVLSGFGTGNEGIAVVLAADNINLNTANGFAVVYGGSGKRNYRLVYFTNGLWTGTLTDIINSSATEFAASTNYVSERVTYNPSNNAWQLFWRDDATTPSVDPSTGVNTQSGSTTVFATGTNTAMSVFGFLSNYNTTANFLAFFDNFSVSLTPELYVTPNSFTFSNQAVGTSSDAQTFNLSGYYLTGYPASITVTAPSTDFQVSSDSINWGPTAYIAYTSATLGSTKVYVRFTPQSTSITPGNITFSGGGVSYPPIVALSATGVTAFNWTNGAHDGLWTSVNNWSALAVPGAGAVVTFNGNYTLRISGFTTISLTSITLGSNANVTLNDSIGAAATITLSNTGNALNIPVGATLTLSGGVVSTGKAVTLQFSGAGNRVNIDGTLNLTNINAGSAVGATLKTANSTTTVGGLLNDDASGTITSNSSNLIIASGGTYQLSGTQSAIPLATWSTGSTCKISGISGGTLSNAGQSFYNFTVDAPGITANVNCNGALTTVNGDFTINNTNGTSNFRLATNQAITLTIGGNFIINSNAQLDLSSTNSGSPVQIINIGGDFSIPGSGKLIRTNTTGTATINFNAASGTQHFTCVPATGINTNTITWNVGDGVTTTNTLQLLSGFIMSTASSLNVLTNATLDCETGIVQATTPGTGGSFTLNSGANLFIGSGNGIYSTGNNLGNIQTALRSFDPAANYTYNGIVAQVTGNAVSTFNNSLTISNTAGTPTVTLTNSITSNGTVFFNGGKLVTSGKTLALNGTVSGMSASNCITGDAAATLNIGGSSGGSLGTLYFDSGSGNEINNITMSRSGTSPSVTLGTNLTIDGILTFTDGWITTGSNMVIIKNTAPGAVVAVANPNYSLGWVNGTLKRNYASAATGTYDFPVGVPPYARLASMTVTTGLVGPTSFTASFGTLRPGNNSQLAVWETTFPDNPIRTPYISINPAGSWIISPDVEPAAGGAYNMELYFNGMAGLLDNEFALLKRPDTSTTFAGFKTGGGTVNATGGVGRVLSGGFALRMGLTSFSEFAIGQSGNVLPIQLVSFTAEKCDNNVDALLQWNTASELNNDHFDIQSAAATLVDGELNFTTIGEVKGNGTSDVGHSYTFTDNEPNKSGTYYYRLKQVDTDSSESYSNIQSLLFEGGNATVISLYPNPNNGQFSINFSTPLTQESSATIEVINLLGQTLFSQVETLSPGSSTNTVALGGSVAPGMYFTRVTVGSNVYVTKLNVTGK